MQILAKSSGPDGEPCGCSGRFRHQQKLNHLKPRFHSKKNSSFCTFTFTVHSFDLNPESSMANSYRALTRTYRPQVFEDVVSQEHVSSTLKNAIAQNRLSHAYMFCGPRGVGKTTMARVLARSINQIDDTVDGESLSQTLNVVEIDAASNNKVEDIHHLREIVRVPPQSGRYKIFIIDEVHMLSKAAFNALLKTLEEPPPHAIFIFATTEPHKVLPTILSRVQRFDFKRISVEEIVKRLEEICTKEGIVIDKESLHTIAKKADGALRDALGLMDQAIAFCGTNIEYRQLIEALNVVGNDQLFEFTEAVSEQNSNTGLKLIDRLLKEGIDIQEFLVSLTAHIRNLYVARQSDRMYLVEATEETKSRYIEAAKKFSDSDLMRILHLVSEAQMKIRDVQQPRVHFEILMLKLIHMGRSKEIQVLLDGLDELKKKHNSSPKGLKPHQGGVDSGSTASNSSISSNGSGPVEKSMDGHGQEKGKKESLSESGHAEDEQSFSETGNGDIGPEKESTATTADEGPRKEVAGSKPLPKEPVARHEVSTQNRSPEVETEEKGTDEGELVLGKTSLRPSARKNPQPAAKEPETGHKTAQPMEGQNRGPSSVSEVQKVWPEYLALLEQKVSKTVFHQLENVMLKDLKGAELYVSVSNVFAVNIVEENKLELAELLKEVVGKHFRFNCVVERSNTVSTESESPYERFKKVQQKDPHLKTIVELFGAEVEY